jgi:O-antigen ligase
MTTTIRILSLVIIGTIPILFAAVQPWVWSVYCLSMIAAFVLHVWNRGDQALFSRINPLPITVTLFFVSTLALCLPFPYRAVEWLSPARAGILSQAWTLTGDTPAWVTLSYLPGAAFGWWVFLLSLGLFYCVVAQLCTERKMLKGLVFVIIGVGLLEAAYGLIQALVPSVGVLWVDYVQAYLGRARGTFINRNNFAGFIEMIWPLALGMTLAMTGRVHSLRAALGSDRLNRQALMALGIIVLLLALIFTGSRAGIVSGLIGFLTFSILARTGMKKISVHTRLLLGGITVLLCVYTLSIGIGPVMHRFLSIGIDGDSRLGIWHDSLPIVKAHPLGIGLGNYQHVFAVHNWSLNSDQAVVYAHNDYLQLLVEAGWVGFLALTGSFFIFLVNRLRRINQLDCQRDPLRFYLAIGAFSGLISMTAHSFFDFNLQIPANCLYFVVLMAVLSACTATPPCVPSPNRTFGHRGLNQKKPSPRQNDRIYQ